MAVRIRLQRKGSRHQAFYRIVVADSRSPRDGRFVEQLGYYDPLTDPAEIKVDTEKTLEWFAKGARPTETVKSLFSRVGVMETWHLVRQGKSYDELRHIEDDARKRMEAEASMQKRKKEESKAAKKAAKAEEAEPAAVDSGSEAADAEEAAPEPAAEPQEEAAAPDAGGEEAAEAPAEAGASEAAAVEPAAEPEPEKTEG